MANELRAALAQRGELLGRMENMMAAVGEGDFTDEQQVEYASAERELRGVNLRLEQINVDQELKRQAGRSATALEPVPGSLFDLAPVGSLPRGGTSGRGGKTYASLFGVDTPSTGGWGSVDEYLEALHTGLADPRLRVAASAGEGVGSDGGFLVPETLAARILDASLEDEIVRPMADVWPMRSETLKVPGVDASDSSSELFGGISGQWVEESGTITAEDVKFRKVELHARKLAILTKASNEIREDGISFEEQLEGALRTATSWFMDYAFLRGTGAGQPLGMLNDPAVVEVAKQPGQVADTVEFQNLAKMLARLHPRCFAKSIWVANPTVIPQLLELAIPTGTAGDVVPAMRESDGRFSILTRRVYFSEKLPSLGDAGDIILVDPSQYAIGLRQQMTLDRSGHVYFTSDETAYRLLVRVDGQGKWSGPYTPANGDTTSWIVTLEAR